MSHALNQPFHDYHAFTPHETSKFDLVRHHAIARPAVIIIGSLMTSLVALRVVLSLVGASPSGGFAMFIYALSYPFVAPVSGIFHHQLSYGAPSLDIAAIVSVCVLAALTSALVWMNTISED